MPASVTSLGLAIGLRRSANLIWQIIESSNDMILACKQENEFQVIIGNVYRSPVAWWKSLTLDKVFNLSQSSNSDCLLVGIWNETLESVVRKLHNRDVNVFATNAPAKSTQANKNLKRSKQIIDYSLSNFSSLILSQQICHFWHLSGERHLSVGVRSLIVFCFVSLKYLKL